MTTAMDRPLSGTRGLLAQIDLDAASWEALLLARAARAIRLAPGRFRGVEAAGPGGAVPIDDTSRLLEEEMRRRRGRDRRAA
jgi:hypothetical protein